MINVFLTIKIFRFYKIKLKILKTRNILGSLKNISILENFKLYYTLIKFNIIKLGI